MPENTQLAVAPIVSRHYNGEPLRIGNPIHIVNPDDKQWTRHRYLFTFGQVGCAFMLVYGNEPCEALELAAEFCAEQEWYGFVTPHEQVAESDDLGCDCANPFECDSHTYTEAGWLTSWEWTFCEDPSNETLRNIHKGSN